METPEGMVKLAKLELREGMEPTEVGVTMVETGQPVEQELQEETVTPEETAAREKEEAMDCPVEMAKQVGNLKMCH